MLRAGCQDGTSDYEYDKTSQLTAADHSYMTDESYSYDANGNRTMTGYSTGDNNQLTSDGTYNYTYDDEGSRLTRTNISTGAATEYTWDHRNRLIAVTEKTSGGTVTKRVEYEYDVFDRRISRAVDTSSPFTMADAAIERYVYDDVTGVASANRGNVVLDFQDADGSGSAPLELAKRYLYGQAVDQILAQENVAEGISDADRVYWPLVDHLGTARDVAQQDGTIAEHYEYDSFGQVVAGDTSLTRYLFAGREYDGETGLHYNRARYYAPAIGRWVSEDPIGFVAGDANLARYVSNSPLNFSDSSGTEIDSNGVSSYGELRTVMGVIIAEAPEATTQEYLERLREHFSPGGAPGRFVYSESRGWVDMKHFVEAYIQVNKWWLTTAMVEDLGVTVETLQASEGSSSAWGVEDLPSNRAGLDMAKLPATTKQDVVKNVFGTLGKEGTPKGTIEEYNQIYNFGYSPVTDPSQYSVSPDGLKYQSSGKQVVDEERLRQIRAGLNLPKPVAPKAPSSGQPSNY